MLEMQAVIGRIQLQQMNDWNKARRHNMSRIQAIFANHPYFIVSQPPQNYIHAAYKCYVQVNTETLPETWSRDKIMSEMNAHGIPCFSGSCSEVYLEKAFDQTNWRPQKRLVNAQRLGETSLMFLVHPTLSETSLDQMVEGIQSVINQI